MMKEIATILINDADSGSDGAVIVRAGGGLIGLCVSIMENGDAEAFFGQSDCRKILKALETALASIEPE